MSFGGDGEVFYGGHSDSPLPFAFILKEIPRNWSIKDIRCSVRLKVIMF
jgi:hypothetical protein